jgi:hypothetical protein
MDKQEQINKLVEEDIEDVKRTILNHNEDTFLRDILLTGWEGYNKMNDEEINEEYKRRFE